MKKPPVSRVSGSDRLIAWVTTLHRRTTKTLIAYKCNYFSGKGVLCGNSSRSLDYRYNNPMGNHGCVYQ